MFKCFAQGCPCQLELLRMMATFHNLSSASTWTLSLLCEEVVGRSALLSSHLGLRLLVQRRCSPSTATKVRFSHKWSNFKSQPTTETSKSAWAGACKSCSLIKISTTSWMSRTSPSEIRRLKNRLARRLRLTTLFHSPSCSSSSNLSSFMASIHKAHQHKVALMI
jgi:hypothetical protein